MLDENQRLELNNETASFSPKKDRFVSPLLALDPNSLQNWLADSRGGYLC